MTKDEGHLDLLAIFHYVVGGLAMLFGCFPIIHLVLGILMLAGALDDGRGQPPPPVVGLIFIIMAAIAILLMWTLGLCIILAGQRLKARRSYTFCFIIAAIGCVFMPFGTVLGVFTIIVLSRPTVKPLFDQAPTAVAI
jgi:hypothetical protein